MISVRAFYGRQSDLVEIKPVPTVSISTEIFRNNDNIIGYEYNVTLEGYVVAKEAGQLEKTGLHLVLQEIDKLRKIFDVTNGGTLKIEYGLEGEEEAAIYFLGSKINSINFNQPDQFLVNYASYTVNMTFNEVSLHTCNEVALIPACTGVIFKNYNKSFIDIGKHRIRSFQDRWSIDLSDDIYNNFGSGIQNQTFAINYNVSAEGMHYFNYNGDEINDPTLLPAWEQAKNFCQDRLYDEVKKVVESGILFDITTEETCGPESLTPFSTGIVIPTGEYKVFNETISCDSSESDGSFSLDYNAIIKYIVNPNVSGYSGLPDWQLSQINAIHNITVDHTHDVIDNNHIISINGEIRGLIEGGITKESGFPSIELPQYGTLLLSKQKLDAKTKYRNALTAYTGIVIANSADLLLDFKNYLDITWESLDIPTPCSGFAPNGPKPNDFNTSHQYADGVIQYSASFSSASSSFAGQTWSNINIEETDPVIPIVEINVPGRGRPVIQKLNYRTPKKINLAMEGAIGQDCCIDLNEYIHTICAFTGQADPPLLPLESGLPVATGVPLAILTKNQITHNPIDGSFSVQREYTFYDTIPPTGI